MIIDTDGTPLVNHKILLIPEENMLSYRGEFRTDSNGYLNLTEQDCNKLWVTGNERYNVLKYLESDDSSTEKYVGIGYLTND